MSLLSQARHGTRSPTKKRIKQLASLPTRFKALLSEAEEKSRSLSEIPSWLRGWESPWKGKVKGGELVTKGEVELYNIGLRIREKFPNLFEEAYHPDVYTIRSSQVSFGVFFFCSFLDI